MEKITISGAVVDWINLITFRDDQIKNGLFRKDKTVYYYLDEISKYQLIELLQHYDPIWGDDDNSVTFLLPKNNDEIQKERDHAISNRLYAIGKIKNYKDKSEDKARSLMLYLKRHEISIPELV